MYTGPLELINVAREARFRIMLRIYALPESSNPMVRVRYYDMSSDRLLFTEDVVLQTYPLASGVPGVLSITPSSIARGGIETIPALEGVTALRVEVAPASTDLRFWAFASVTNNDTQQVTAVTPQ
jgi:hypothetical protein